MSYVCDGTPYEDSVDDETKFVDWLNRGGHKRLDFLDGFQNAEKRGGSKVVEDAIATLSGDRTVRFSCKLAKKGIEKTSFTFYNSTKFITKIKQNGTFLGINKTDLKPAFDFEKFRDKELKDNPDRPDRELKIETTYRPRMDAVSYELMDKFSTNRVLKRFINGIIDHYKDIDYFVHTDREKRKMYMYEPKHHPLFHYITEGYFPTAWRNSMNVQTTKGLQVALLKSRDLKNLSLYFRLHYNNGVSAFFKCSDSNTNAHLCLKLQQNTGSLPGVINWIREQDNLTEVDWSE